MRLAARTLTLVLLATLVFWGCRSMYDSGDTPEVTTPTTVNEPVDDLLATGYYVPGSHNIPGGGPPPLALPEEENEGDETQSHFRAIQIDPLGEDTAGAKFIAATYRLADSPTVVPPALTGMDGLGYAPIDIDGDGLVDVVTGHNQSQPVQLHLQRRDEAGTISFQTVTIGGTIPISIIAGLEVADMDQDGALDIVVLVKHTGLVGYCLDGQADADLFTGVIIIYFSPLLTGDVTDGDQWLEVQIEDSHSQVTRRWGRAQESNRAIDYPEEGGYTSLAVGDVDGVNGPDIVATSNVPDPDCGTGMHAVELWLNPGADASRVGDSQRISINTAPDLEFPATYWYPIWVMGVYPLVIAAEVETVDDVVVNTLQGDIADVTIFDAAPVKDCALLDVDADGDLDIISLWSTAVSQNVRWSRNPLVEEGSSALLEGTFINSNRALLGERWQRRPIGTVDADLGALTLGDMDGDGFADVLVRSFSGSVSAWFRRPTTDTSVEPVFPPEDPEAGTGDNTPVPDRWDFPWNIYALDDYAPYRPIGLAVGDLTMDGFNDAAISVGGALYWYDPTLVASVYDLWGRDFVLDDTKANGTTDDPTDLDYVDDGTIINSLVIVDVDADGVNDVLAVFDRRVNSGLADDAVLWFRNTLFDQPDEEETEDN